MNCKVIEIVEDGSKRVPVVFDFTDGSLDICRYNIVPGRGLYVQIARKHDPKNVGTAGQLEELGGEFAEKPVKIEFYDEDGTLVKTAELKVLKYAFEKDEELGYCDRVFFVKR